MTTADSSRREDLKVMVRRLEAVIEILILTVLFYLIWHNCYRYEYFRQLLGRGKYVLMGVYFMLSYILLKMCEALEFGHLKVPETVISSIAAMSVVNFMTYWEVCLIANYMVSPLPMLGLSGMDIVVCILCALIFTAIDSKGYAPHNMLLIYGAEESLDLKPKLESRQDRYTVTEIIPWTAGRLALEEAMARHDSVILIDIPGTERNDILKYCYSHAITTYVSPKISDIIIKGAPDITLFDTPLMKVKGRGLSMDQEFIKRAFDLALCFIAFVPFLIIFIIVAAAIRLDDHGPVFYRQYRVTRDGRVFRIIKFRSMKVHSEQNESFCRAVDNDSRITRVGRVIRRFRIDELPQIINIARGEMSWVGPRAEHANDMQLRTMEVMDYPDRLKVKAGLVGYAQIYGKYNTNSYDKLRLDLIYIENYSIMLDLKLIFMTIRAVLSRESTDGDRDMDELETKRQEILRDQANRNLEAEKEKAMKKASTDPSAWRGKKIIAVNSSSTYEYRVKLFRSVMEGVGAELFIVGSDYDHIAKKKRTCMDENTVFLETRPYRKNISIDRVRSHLEFSRDALKRIEALECDLLYLILPPNSQAGIARAYKKRHPDVRILMDVIDLWPESFPMRIPKLWPFSIWAGYRNKFLKDADLLFTECRLYQDAIGKYIDEPENMTTIYWAHQPETPEQGAAIEESIKAFENSMDKWILGYLGSVNNITNISVITEAVKYLQQTRPVVVRIVGAGEKIMELENSLKRVGARVENYGEVYDFDQKLRIFGSCHFGLNFMKHTVAIGMTMKSVDYLQMGVPILNDLPGEAGEIIREHYCGRNFTEIWKFRGDLFDPKMKANARDFYLKNCSYEAYRKNILRAMEKIRDHNIYHKG